MLYPSLNPRITTFNSAGVKLHRWTLQTPLAASRVLEVETVGAESTGRPPNGARAVVLHGFRPTFHCAWDYSFSSFRETWNGTAWVSSTEMQTAMALIDIAQACENYPVLVEVAIGIPDPWWFLARAYNDPQVVKDENGILHADLALKLVGESLLPAIPDFGGYFVPGYIQGTTAGGEGYFSG